MNGSLPLRNAAGELVYPQRDFSAITPQDEEYLKTLPGVFEAYSGLQSAAKLKLSVVQVEGSSLKLDQALQDFAGAPAAIRSDLDAVTTHFVENYSDKMKGMLETTAMDKTNNHDPRNHEDREQAPTAMPGDSDEATIRAQMNITIECKAMDIKNIVVLGDDSGNIWLLAKAWCYN